MGGAKVINISKPQTIYFENFTLRGMRNRKTGILK
jgi:hypothetical protein